MSSELITPSYHNYTDITVLRSMEMVCIDHHTTMEDRLLKSFNPIREYIENNIDQEELKKYQLYGLLKTFSVVTDPPTTFSIVNYSVPFFTELHHYVLSINKGNRHGELLQLTESFWKTCVENSYYYRPSIGQFLDYLNSSYSTKILYHVTKVTSERFEVFITETRDQSFLIVPFSELINFLSKRQVDDVLIVKVENGFIYFEYNALLFRGVGKDDREISVQGKLNPLTLEYEINI